MDEPKKYLDSLMSKVQGSSWKELPRFREAFLAQNIKKIFQMKLDGEKASVIFNKIKDGNFYSFNPMERSKELQFLQLNLMSLDFAIQYQELGKNYNNMTMTNLRKKLNHYFHSLKNYFQEFYMNENFTNQEERISRLLARVQKQIDQIECLEW